MRERSSATEILALYDSGDITALEVLNAAWEQCHNNPVLRSELVRQFLAFSDEYIASFVGHGLEKWVAKY